MRNIRNVAEVAPIDAGGAFAGKTEMTFWEIAWLEMMAMKSVSARAGEICELMSARAVYQKAREVSVDITSKP